MEEVKDTIGIDPHSPADGGCIRRVADRMRQLTNWRRSHGVLLHLRVQQLVRVISPGLAADTLGNIRAGLGGVAGLAGISGVRLICSGTIEGMIRVPTQALSARSLGCCGVAFLARGIAGRGRLGVVGHFLCGKDAVGLCAFPLAASLG